MDAPRTPAHDETLLIFAIHGIRCGVPAQSVDTIVMPPSHLTHPPGSNRTRPGIFAHNGQVHGVVDLREAFGVSDENSSGRLLLYHFGELHYAFVVDEVVGLVRSEEGQWVQLPPDLPRKTFTRGFLHQQEIVLCSDFPRLLRLEDGEPLRRHFASVVAARTAATTPPAPPTAPLPLAAAPATPLATAAQQNATPPPPAPAVTAARTAALPQLSPPPRPLPPPRARANRPTQRAATPPQAAVAAPPPRAPLRPPPATPRPPLSPAEPLAVPAPRPAPATPRRWMPQAVALPLLLITLTAGWWFWPTPQRAAPATPAPEPPRPQATPPTAAPLQPLRIEKGSSGLTLIVEESAFTPRTDATAASPPVPHEGRRILHRVKKGDTLWGIAERYVQNPWHFRELAHQSGIDNPDLIYPGDEVTILIR